MAVLFALVIMRVSGALALNPVFGRTNLPLRAKACMIVAISVLLYQTSGGELAHTPRTMAEYIVMLMGELLMGLILSFVMELAFMVVRFASAVMDYCMGLSMAQIYDPQYGTQATVSSGLYYVFMALVFFATNGHLRLLGIFFASAQAVPFGTMSLDPRIAQVMTEAFCQAVIMGLQFAFPLIAIEMMSEAAMGILMRIVPQINVFAVNFQVKIAVGLLMFLLMFTPMADRLEVILDRLYVTMQHLVVMMQSG